MSRYDLVCIGSGPAGEKAALMAASVGKRVAIVERDPMPGGAMVNTGTIASKVLRETALLCSAFRRRPVPGVDFCLDRTISFRRFMARKTLVQLEEHDRIERSIDRLGIDVYRGHGRIAGDHLVQVTAPDGSTADLATERLLLAVGSRPHHPTSVDFAHHAIVDCEGILNLERMPSSLIVVGAGVIGCEYACIFAEMGVTITLVEPRDAILSFLDGEIRALLTAQMESLETRILLSSPPESAHGNPDGSATVVLKDGRTESADVVLWSLGRIGNTEGIGLEEVGLKPEPRGLLRVDEHYRTDVPWIWAAGDVVGFPALASTSHEQGRIAAANMFGLASFDRLGSTVPIGIYTIPAVASVGRTEEEAIAQGLDVVVGRARYRNNPRGRMLGDDQGLLKIVFDARSGRALGASIIGEDATEQIHLAQMAIACGAGMDYFLHSCFNYPSLGELFKYAALDARNSLERSRASRDAA